MALSTPSSRMNAIRLVNVIGSPGSVVPIFQKQIAEGGPVTVTHPQATRWFMSLHEAVRAILGAGAAEIEGRILVPAVGVPTRIVDLARSLIGAADEIAIVFSGCRPGDKLTEELVTKSETREGTIDGPLHVVGTCRIRPAELDQIIERLSVCIASHDVPGLIQTLGSVVPEYVPSEIIR